MDSRFFRRRMLRRSAADHRAPKDSSAAMWGGLIMSQHPSSAQVLKTEATGIRPYARHPAVAWAPLAQRQGSLSRGPAAPVLIGQPPAQSAPTRLKRRVRWT